MMAVIIAILTAAPELYVWDEVEYPITIPADTNISLPELVTRLDVSYVNFITQTEDFPDYLAKNELFNKTELFESHYENFSEAVSESKALMIKIK